MIDAHDISDFTYKSPARVNLMDCDQPYDPLRAWAERVECALFEAGYPKARVWWHWDEGENWDNPSHAVWGDPLAGVDPAKPGDTSVVIGEKWVPEDVFQKACALAGPVPRI